LLIDTTKDDQVRDAVETVRSELKQANKQLFSVICNAGYAESFPIETTTQGDYDKIFGGTLELILTLILILTQLQQMSTEPSPRSNLLYPCYANIQVKAVLE
jgi:short-subunit dehydrogenase